MADRRSHGGQTSLKLFIYSSPLLCELVLLHFIQDKFINPSNWGETPKFSLKHSTALNLHFQSQSLSIEGGIIGI